MRKSAIGAAMAGMFLLSLPSFAAGPQNHTNKATKAMSDSVQQTPNTGGVAPDEGNAVRGGNKFEAAAAGMRASKENAKRVQSMSKVSFLQIVDVGTGGGSQDKAAIEKAAAENRSSIKALQDAIRANAALSAKLKEKSVGPESVVATRLNDDGSLTVYVDKPIASH